MVKIINKRNSAKDMEMKVKIQTTDLSTGTFAKSWDQNYMPQKKNDIVMLPRDSVAHICSIQERKLIRISRNTTITNYITEYGIRFYCWRTGTENKRTFLILQRRSRDRTAKQDRILADTEFLAVFLDS